MAIDISKKQGASSLLSSLERRREREREEMLEKYYAERAKRLREFNREKGITIAEELGESEETAYARSRLMGGELDVDDELDKDFIQDNKKIYKDELNAMAEHYGMQPYELHLHLKQGGDPVDFEQPPVDPEVQNAGVFERFIRGVSGEETTGAMGAVGKAGRWLMEGTLEQKKYLEDRYGEIKGAEAELNIYRTRKRELLDRYKSTDDPKEKERISARLEDMKGKLGAVHEQFTAGQKTPRELTGMTLKTGVEVGSMMPLPSSVVAKAPKIGQLLMKTGLGRVILGGFKAKKGVKVSEKIAEQTIKNVDRKSLSILKKEVATLPTPMRQAGSKIVKGVLGRQAIEGAVWAGTWGYGNALSEGKKGRELIEDTIDAALMGWAAGKAFQGLGGTFRAAKKARGAWSKAAVAGEGRAGAAIKELQKVLKGAAKIEYKAPLKKQVGKLEKGLVAREQKAIKERVLERIGEARKVKGIAAAQLGKPKVPMVIGKPTGVKPSAGVWSSMVEKVKQMKGKPDVNMKRVYASMRSDLRKKLHLAKKEPQKELLNTKLKELDSTYKHYTGEKPKAGITFLPKEKVKAPAAKKVAPEAKISTVEMIENKLAKRKVEKIRGAEGFVKLRREFRDKATPLKMLYEKGYSLAQKIVARAKTPAQLTEARKLSLELSSKQMDEVQRVIEKKEIALRKVEKKGTRTESISAKIEELTQAIPKAKGKQREALLARHRALSKKSLALQEKAKEKAKEAMKKTKEPTAAQLDEIEEYTTAIYKPIFQKTTPRKGLAATPITQGELFDGVAARFAATFAQEGKRAFLAGTGRMREGIRGSFDRISHAVKLAKDRDTATFIHEISHKGIEDKLIRLPDKKMHQKAFTEARELGAIMQGEGASVKEGVAEAMRMYVQSPEQLMNEYKHLYQFVRHNTKGSFWGAIQDSQKAVQNFNSNVIKDLTSQARLIQSPDQLLSKDARDLMIKEGEKKTFGAAFDYASPLRAVLGEKSAAYQHLRHEYQSLSAVMEIIFDKGAAKDRKIPTNIFVMEKGGFKSSKFDTYASISDQMKEYFKKGRKYKIVGAQQRKMMGDIDDYLLSKHALERKTEIFGEKPLEKLAAGKTIKKFEKSGDEWNKKVVEFAGKFRDSYNQTIELVKNSGYVTDGQKAYLSKYKNHVPVYRQERGGALGFKEARGGLGKIAPATVGMEMKMKELINTVYKRRSSASYLESFIKGELPPFMHKTVNIKKGAEVSKIIKWQDKMGLNRFEMTPEQRKKMTAELGLGKTLKEDVTGEYNPFLGDDEIYTVIKGKPVVAELTGISSTMFKDKSTQLSNAFHQETSIWSLLFREKTGNLQRDLKHWEALLDRSSKLAGEGKRKFWAAKTAGSAVRAFSKTFRTGVIYQAGFWMRNVWRDAMLAGIRGKVAMGLPIGKLIKGYLSSLSKESAKATSRDPAQRLTSMIMDRSWIAHAQMMGGAAERGIGGKGLLREWATLPWSKFEKAPREAVVKAMVQKKLAKAGIKDLSKEIKPDDIFTSGELYNIIFAAEDVTTNFAMKGWATAKTAKYVPFWKAGVNALINWSRWGKKAGWAGYTVSTLAGLSTVGMPIMLWNMADPERRKRFYSHQPVQRALFWFVEMPNGESYKIPKPYDPTVGLYNVLEYGAHRMMDEDPTVAGKGFLARSWYHINSTYAPHGLDSLDPRNAMPSFMQAAWDVSTNRDHFFDRPIVSPYYESLPKRGQYHRGTSAYAKWMGESLGVSPLVADFVVNKMGGGMAKSLQTLTSERGKFEREIYAEKLGSEAAGKTVGTALHIAGVSKRVTRMEDVGFRSARYTNFTERLKDIEQEYKLLRGEKKHLKIGMIHNTLTKDKKKFNELYDRIVQIERSKTMSVGEKNKRIRAINKQVEKRLDAIEKKRVWSLWATKQKEIKKQADIIREKRGQ